MMEATLPERLVLDRLPPEGITVSGNMPVTALPRLRALLVSDSGLVETKLRLTPTRGAPVLLDGSLAVTVQMRCQRCLEPVRLPLRITVAGVVVRSEREAERLGRDDEPVVAPRGELDLRTTVEDELLLALPVVPRHEAECRPRQRRFAPPGADTPAPDSPFHVLSGLRSEPDDEHGP